MLNENRVLFAKQRAGRALVGRDMRRALQKCLDGCVDKCVPPEVNAALLQTTHSQQGSHGKSPSLSREGASALVRVEPPCEGVGRLSREDYDAIVNLATPEDRWWTPRGGWPRNQQYAIQPVNLMPTATEDQRYFLPKSAELGELRLEILETDGLPQMDMVGFENDVYAVAVFEESVAATPPVPDVQCPRLHYTCARAFRFPVVSPHSKLYVGLFDSDAGELVNATFASLTTALETLDSTVSNVATSVQSGQATRKCRHESGVSRKDVARVADGAIDTDDAIGRVEVDLRGMHPGTVYDAWYELRRNVTLDDRGQFGAVRLRYSLTWTAPERRRLLAYLSPPPIFVTNVGSRNQAETIAFAVQGHGDESDMDAKFELQTFKSHAYEFKSYMLGGVYAAIAAVNGLILYEQPAISLVGCFYWQLLCTYPQLLPSCLPLALLGMLRATYVYNRIAFKEELYRLGRTPGFFAHTAALLLPRPLYKLPPIDRPVEPASVEAIAKAIGLPDASADALSAALAMIPNGGQLSQAQINKLREQLTTRNDAKEAAKAERSVAFEAALEKHAQAIKLRESLAAGFGAVGGAVSSITNHIGENLDQTFEGLDSAGKTLLMGDVFGAGVGVAATAVRTATKAATGAAKLGVSTVQAAAQTAVVSVEDTVNKSKDAVNPMQLVAAYLQPVQTTLAYYLQPLRGLHGVFSWHDPALTTALCHVLAITACILPWLPWLIISRLAGLAVLGPHMWLVGARQRKAAAAEEPGAKSVADEYAEANESRRRAILELEYNKRQRKANEEKAALDKARAALPFADHAEYRKNYANMIEVQGNRVTGTKLYTEPSLTSACPVRSMAEPANARRPNGHMNGCANGHMQGKHI